MLTLTSPQVVQETVLRWKRECKVGFVPTMGCLHEGHLRLILKARQFAPKVIVSIFVNPLQFGPNEDFTRYPRPFEEDRAKLDELNVDLLFVPSIEELYPNGFDTKVHVGKLGETMEGQFRPGHFDGVATVCLKLFQIAQPDFVVFGEKDFQQLRIIQQMAADFNLPTTVVSHPTVRDGDRLAISSRNRYLSNDERLMALKLPQALNKAQTLVSNSGATVKGVLNTVREILSGLSIDYVTVASTQDLNPCDETTRVEDVVDPRIFAAIRVGSTRLIDNLPLTAEEK